MHVNISRLFGGVFMRAAAACLVLVSAAVLATAAHAEHGGGGICGRTMQVHDEIVAALETAGVITAGETCADVSADDLSDNRFTALDLAGKNITSLRAGDFAGLDSLQMLYLNDNMLATLPPGVFAGLESVAMLTLYKNSYTALPPGVFTGLNATLQNTLGVPGKPQNLSATAPSGENGNLSVSWGAPAETGAGAGGIHGYTLRWRLAGAGAGFAENDADTVDADAVNHTISGLIPYEIYDVEIAARSRYRFPAEAAMHLQTNMAIVVGGDFAAAEKSPPPPPQNVSVTPGDHSLRITWDATRDAFAYVVTHYALRWKKSSAAEFADADARTVAALDLPLTGSGTARSATLRDFYFSMRLETIAGLDNGDEYVVEVAAVNFAGEGAIVREIETPRASTLCARTQEVQEAIIAQLKQNNIVGMNDACADVSEANLADSAISVLNFHDANISSLRAGDFDGLVSLRELDLSENMLAELPAGMFRELESLRILKLHENNFAELPAGVFAGLGRLTTLTLAGNPFTNMTQPDIFAGLNMTLQRQLGVPGAPQIDTLILPANAEGEIALTWRAPEYTGGGGGIHAYQLRWKLSRSADFPELVFALVTDAAHTVTGLVAGEKYDVQVAAFSRYPFPLNPGAHAATTDAIQIGGDYAEARQAQPPTPPQNVTAAPGNESIRVDWAAPAEDSGQPVRAYQLRWKPPEAAEFAGMNMAAAAAETFAHIIRGLNNGREYEVQVAAVNALGVGEYSASMRITPRADAICARTLQVRDKIVAALKTAGVIADAETCAAVTAADLSDNRFITLDLAHKQIASLRAGDFAGLRALQTLKLNDNRIAQLPGGAFDDLVSLRVLNLKNNELRKFPPDMFIQLGALQELDLSGNIFADFPPNTFAGLGDAVRREIGIPGPVQNIQPILPTDASGTLTVQWDAPEHIGMPALYTLRWKLSIAKSFAADNVIATSDTTYEIGGAASAVSPLNADALYDVQIVAAEFFKFHSPTSSSPAPFINGDYVGAPKVTTPPPAITSAGAGDGVIHVIWDAPERAAAFGVSGYALRWKKSDAAEFTGAGTAAGGDTIAHTIRNLENGATYQAQVAAVNVFGAGEYSTSATATPGAGTTCTRTMQVRDEIIRLLKSAGALEQNETCADTLAADLAMLSGTFDLSNKSINALRAGDFAGLDAIEELHLRQNPLAALPAGVFEGLDSLRALELRGNALATLSPGVFDGLGQLRKLQLHNTALRALPAGVFDKLVELRTLGLHENAELETLPAGVFDDLENLRTLRLHETGLTTLPIGIFSALSLLGDDMPTLHSNHELTGFPPGVFTGLSANRQIVLGIPGAPQNISPVLPANADGEVNVSWDAPNSEGAGDIAGYTLRWKLTDALSFAGGGLQFVMANTRAHNITGLAAGETYDVQIAAINQYKFPSALFSIIAAQQTPAPIRVGGDYASAPEVTRPPAPQTPAATFGDRVIHVSWDEIAHAGLFAVTEYKLRWKKSDAAEFAEADTAAVAADTFAYTIGNLENDIEYQAQVAAVNVLGAGEFSMRVNATPTGGATCSRTLQVRDAIVAALKSAGMLSANQTCAHTTAMHLTNLTDALDVSGGGLTAIRAGDFAGLTALQVLDLSRNDLTALPPGVFNGLDALQVLDLHGAALTKLPAAAFDGLGALQTLELHGTSLSQISPAAFDGLNMLRTLNLHSNRNLPELPAQIFANLEKLQTLNLRNNGLTTLPPGIFAELENLETLIVHSNRSLTSLPPGVFTGIAAEDQMRLGVPGAPQNIAPVSPADADGNLQVSWHAPAYLGEGMISDYTLRWKLTDAESFAATDFAHSAGAAMKHTITALAAGETYDVKIAATSNYRFPGDGDSLSWTISAIPVGGDFADATHAVPPAAPQNVTATFGDESMNVMWNAPDENGGADVLSYTLRWKKMGADFADGDVATELAATTTHIIMELDNGSEYEVQVAAVNAAGSGTFSASANATPAAAPGIPQNIATEFGDGEIIVTWSALNPDENGGATVTTYQLMWTSSATETATTFIAADTAAADNTLTHTIAGLTNGTTYEVQVAAVNKAGTGTFSKSATETPATMPGIPQNVTAEFGDENINAAWEIPASDGGGGIISYTLRWKSEVAATFSMAVTTADTRDYNITELENGLEYEVQVAAVNKAGAGEFSMRVTETPATPPDAPKNIAAAFGDENINVTWEMPESDGGDSVATYQLMWTSSATEMAATFVAAETAVAADNTLTYTIAGLTNGTTYEVQVAAVNKAGAGEFSMRVTETPATTPDAPENVTAEFGVESIDVAWNEPANNGGATVTVYKLRWKLAAAATFADAGTATTPDNATNFSIGNLENGSEYEVQVAAVNKAGDGNFSDSKQATPATPPGIPQNVTAEFGDASINVTWTAPAENGGAEIISYTLQWKAAETAANFTLAMTTDAAANFSIGGLENGTTYEVQVAAVNKAGAGEFSMSATETPATPPGIPQNVTVAGGDESIVVAWDALSLDENGGATVTTYQLMWTSSADSSADSSAKTAAMTFVDAGTVAAGNTFTYTITGIKNGMTYEVQVAAVNKAGAGEFSEAAPATPVVFNFNIDQPQTEANTATDADARDAIMIARGLLGVTGEALTEGQTNTESETIEENIELGKSAPPDVDAKPLDVDANGVADWRDGVMIARYALGIRGDALIADLTNPPDGKLTDDAGMTPATIEGNIQARRE